MSHSCFQVWLLLKIIRIQIFGTTVPLLLAHWPHPPISSSKKLIAAEKIHSDQKFWEQPAIVANQFCCSRPSTSNSPKQIKTTRRKPHNSHGGRLQVYFQIERLQGRGAYQWRQEEQAKSLDSFFSRCYLQVRFLRREDANLGAHPSNMKTRIDTVIFSTTLLPCSLTAEKTPSSIPRLSCTSSTSWPKSTTATMFFSSRLGKERIFTCG